MPQQCQKWKLQRYATIVKRCATTVPIMVKKMQKCATIVKGFATTVPTVHGRIVQSANSAAHWRG